jgi:hypothetical protein
MKKLLLLALVILLPMKAAASEFILLGDKIGNGGGLWACQKRDKIVKAELVDLFEAREEFNLTIAELGGLTPMQVFESRLLWLQNNIPWLHKKLEFYFRYVEKNHSFTSGILKPIDDSLYRLLPNPKDCRGGKWNYLQFANFTPYGKIIIEKPLWESDKISNVDKGALLVHEAVYFWLRHQHQEVDSAKARHVVALLMSNLDAVAMRAGLEIALQGIEPPVLIPEPDSAVDDSLGFSLRVDNSQINAILHQADAPYGSDVGTSNMGSACRVKEGAQGPEKDILCVLEVEELDLYFSELKLDVNIPTSACSYVYELPYHFYGNEPGMGPKSVSHHELADGTVRDGEHTVNGVPTCAYDYQDRSGPNCCIGTYNRKITRHHSNGQTETTITNDVSWGGSVAACLSGPATSTEWEQYRDQDGFPMPRMDFIRGTGWRKEMKISPAISEMSGAIRLKSNVWAANFYEPSHHMMGMPKAMLAPSSLPNAPRPQDTYEWRCLDSSENVLARIRLMIREWNSGPILENGNPDGWEGNSREDWLDFGDTYPGSRI